MKDFGGLLEECMASESVAARPKGFIGGSDGKVAVPLCCDMVMLCCERRAEDLREDVRCVEYQDRSDLGEEIPSCDISEGDVVRKF